MKLKFQKYINGSLTINDQKGVMQKKLKLKYTSCEPDRLQVAYRILLDNRLSKHIFIFIFTEKSPKHPNMFLFGTPLLLHFFFVWYIFLMIISLAV